MLLAWRIMRIITDYQSSPDPEKEDTSCILLSNYVLMYLLYLLFQFKYDLASTVRTAKNTKLSSVIKSDILSIKNFNFV